MDFEDHIKNIKNLYSSQDFELPEDSMKELIFFQESINPYIIYLFSLSKLIESQKDPIKKDIFIDTYKLTLDKLNQHITKKLNLVLY